MKKKISIILIGVVSMIANAFTALAQYPPQHPLPGNDAIHFTDTGIQSWITSATLQRGWQNIQDTTLGKTTNGDSSTVIGPYNNQVVSLGDSGIITLYFKNGIQNGTGADFAIFENGINNILDSSLAYLELALVEVSSNGIDFVRFPAVSNTQDTVQLTNADFLDASLLHNLAGKYRAGYGTPFDLNELTNTPDFNRDSVYYIRLIDVIGSIAENYAAYDHNDKKINDPFPTPFFTAGFDLNAIGVLHPIHADTTPNTINSLTVPKLSVCPNPATYTIQVEHPLLNYTSASYAIYNVFGQKVYGSHWQAATIIPVAWLSAGKYVITIENKGQLIGYANFIKE